MNARTVPLSPRPLPALAAPRSSWPLGIVGVLMALALLLHANPEFGRYTMWPWERVGQIVGLAEKAVALIWMATAVWLLVFSLSPWYRLRATVVVVLGVTLLLQLAGDGGRIQIQRFDLNEFAPLVGLGVGLLFARNPATGRLGGYVCGVSAIALAVAWGIGFERVGATGALTSHIEAFAHDARIFVKGGDASAYWSAAAVDDPAYPWRALVPHLVMFTVAAGALLVALGFRPRAFATLLLVLLLAALSTPLIVRVVVDFQDADPDLASVAQQVFDGLVADGVCMWLLLCFGLNDLIRHDPANDPWEAAA